MTSRHQAPLTSLQYTSVWPVRAREKFVGVNSNCSRSKTNRTCLENQQSEIDDTAFVFEVGAFRWLVPVIFSFAWLLLLSLCVFFGHVLVAILFLLTYPSWSSFCVVVRDFVFALKLNFLRTLLLLVVLLRLLPCLFLLLFFLLIMCSRRLKAALRCKKPCRPILKRSSEKQSSMTQ